VELVILTLQVTGGMDMNPGYPVDQILAYVKNQEKEDNAKN
jgi:hypothetical protein